MDITKRINIALVLLLAILTAFIAAGSLTDKKRPSAAAPADENRIIKQNAEAQKIFSGSAGEEYAGMMLPSAESMAYTDKYTPMPEKEDTIKNVFTKIKRNDWAAPPEGFFSAVTNDYLIYREKEHVSKDLKALLEKIHGNFVLDIVPFSMFSKFNRVFLMLFRTKESYSTYTNKPSWSIAATDIESQAVYIMENNDFEGNFVHELTHIYFDGFFIPHYSPLWLSEGFAVYMQSHAETPAQNMWLTKNIKAFKAGEYIDFDQFLSVKNLKGYSKDDVVMWYAQAYSVVSFMLQDKSRDEFYQFCCNIKDGMPLGRALYRAYGMPFNSSKALEYAWQSYLHSDAVKSVAKGKK